MVTLPPAISRGSSYFLIPFHLELRIDVSIISGDWFVIVEEKVFSLTIVPLLQKERNIEMKGW